MMDERARAAALSLRNWLFEAALPLWWELGADPRGGFHEQIDLSGRPVDRPQRTRTIARQAFSYCEAGKLGWTGPWRTAARHALEHFDKHYFNADGTVVAAVGRDGRVSDPHFDLYEQAFALLALACAHGAFQSEPQWRTRAVKLREWLCSTFVHSQGGFYEDLEGQVTPLRSNPHMHLLEAALAWMAVDQDSEWRTMADEIAALCLERFIDPESGAVREYFALDWSVMPGLDGRIAEPGHQYEWAFLLDRWARMTNRFRPPEVGRLISFADMHGIDPIRRVAINALLTDGSVHDAGVRLWPQAERLRAYAVVPVAESLRDEAIAGLMRHLAGSLPGWWIERFRPNGEPIDDPAPATSLYHIVGAIAALHG
jgi:mannose-6-phosphate isomerase